MSATLMEAVTVAVETPKLAAPETNPTDKITAISQLPSIWSLKQNIEWLIDGVIPLGSITLLSGESGGGKTWLAYAIAGAQQEGSHLLISRSSIARRFTSTAKILCV